MVMHEFAKTDLIFESVGDKRKVDGNNDRLIRWMIWGLPYYSWATHIIEKNDEFKLDASTPLMNGRKAEGLWFDIHEPAYIHTPLAMITSRNTIHVQRKVQTRILVVNQFANDARNSANWFPIWGSAHRYKLSSVFLQLLPQLERETPTCP